jgi:hypothetical protein
VVRADKKAKHKSIHKRKTPWRRNTFPENVVVVEKNSRWISVSTTKIATGLRLLFLWLFHEIPSGLIIVTRAKRKIAVSEAYTLGVSK